MIEPRRGEFQEIFSSRGGVLLRTANCNDDLAIDALGAFASFHHPADGDAVPSAAGLEF
jgi:hypothetical protein